MVPNSFDLIKINKVYISKNNTANVLQIHDCVQWKKYFKNRYITNKLVKQLLSMTVYLTNSNNHTCSLDQAHAR